MDFPGKVDFGVVCALKAEGEALVRQLEIRWKSEICGHSIFIARMSGGQTLAIIVSGMGKVNAASASQLLIDRFPPGYLFVFGSAGGVNPRLKVGDLILSEQVWEYDYLHPKGTTPGIKGHFSILQTASCLPEIKLGIIATGDQNVDTCQKRDFLRKKFKTDGCDWESSAVMRVAQNARIPTASFRVISDIGKDGPSATIAEFRRNIESVLPPAAKTFIKLLTELPALS